MGKTYKESKAGSKQAEEGKMFKMKKIKHSKMKPYDRKKV